LRRIGLAIGVTARLPFPKSAEGTVLAQDPPGHAQGIEGPSVSLLVAAPTQEAPDGFVMPDFVGLPIVSAQAALEHVGLKNAPPTYVDVHIPPVGQGSAPPQIPQAPGSVIGQQPPAGSRVDQSTQVKFTVAR
jgi:beta-lactam-binding protein with PASTA domain